MNNLLKLVLGDNGDPIPKPGNADASLSPTSKDNLMNINDSLNFALSKGGDVMKTPEGRILFNNLVVNMGAKPAQDVIDSLYVFNKRDDVKSMSPEQKINTYFSLFGDNKNVQDLKQRLNNYGSTSGYGSNGVKYREYPGEKVAFGNGNGLASVIK